MRNILDYGAIGDGVTVNTKAIQSAIDAGGTVYIPEGVFVTGTLHLKSNGGLFLEHGAILRASRERDDYNTADYCPQNVIFEDEYMIGTHLISAVEQENVFISGSGRIDGDSHYWVNENYTTKTGFFGHPPANKNRPGQMIFFAECKNVSVRDVQLTYSPFWHLFFHGCEDVRVSGLYIKGENKQWVNDGIDIDCCKNVTVSDCIIDTGDDAITLRAHSDPLLHSDGVCENIVISNCVLRSYLDFGIRIGVGSGTIRNCLFSNLVIRDSMIGIGIINRYSLIDEGVFVENIRFQNINITAHTAFDINICNREKLSPGKRAHTNHIAFDGLSIYSDRGSIIAGREDVALTHITFRNTDMHFSKGSPENDRFPCNWRDIAHRDAALYMRWIEDIKFEDTRVYFDSEDDFRYSVFGDKIKGFKVIGGDMKDDNTYITLF